VNSHSITIKLPAWIASLTDNIEPLNPLEPRMDFVIGLAERNVTEGSGGPFAAAIFEQDTGRLVSVGVNTVIASNCSLAHAETVALAIAQQLLDTHDLNDEGLPRYELVSSCEPCAMCLGAISWSGIRRMVCAARDEDARAIGFDEGPKISQWQAELEQRGIEVITDIRRDYAKFVMEQYLQLNGEIYNPRRG